MKIKTGKQIYNIIDEWEYSLEGYDVTKDFSNKKWVAVDDELNFLKTTLYVLSYENVYDAMAEIEKRIQELEERK